MRNTVILILAALIILFSTNVQAIERKLPNSKNQVMLSYSPLVKKTAPAVVNIYTSKKVKVRSSLLFNDPFFNQFFGNRLGRQFGMTKERVVNSLGSGVIVGSDGLIITNNHVVKDTSEIKVILSDKREFEAKLVFTDSKTDLALLKIDAEDEKLPYLKLDNADDLEVGDIVLAIGNPFGVGQTVTSGIVSALARTVEGVADFDAFIQTDAAINPGNSGGALINMNGNLIGINTAIYSKSGSSAGIGFATPSTMVKVVINSFRSGSDKVVRPWFGAATQDVTAEIAESMGLAKPVGVLIGALYPGSSVEKAGLKTGDVVIKINEHDIKSKSSLKFRVATHNIGDVAEFTILRSGSGKTLSIKLESPPETPLRNTTRLKGKQPLSGAIVENLSPALAEERGINSYVGVIVTEVVPRTSARRFFKEGDIVVSINDMMIKNIKQLNDILIKEKRHWKISIKRGNKIFSIKVNA